MSLAHFSRQNLPNLWRHFLWPNFREFGRHPRLLTSSDTTFKQYCTTAHRKIWAKQTDRPENLDHNHAWLPIEIQAEVVPRRPASSGEVEFFSVSSAAVGNVPSWSEPCMPMRRRVVPASPRFSRAFLPAVGNATPYRNSKSPPPRLSYRGFIVVQPCQ
jgi:hypothetical protein